jgi:AcrR family transcriptional regulator
MSRTPVRRSQEERSAATRERLLDATISSLIELGYVRTTTTEIVRRAGVSRGAQVHHFPTKAELVQNAVLHLSRRHRESIAREFTRPHVNGDRLSSAIDALWSAYAGQLFTAALELIVAARTDPELRPALVALQADVRGGIEEFCKERFGPRVMRHGSFRDALELTIDVMHGLALVRMIDGSRSRETRLLGSWKKLVRPLLEEAVGDERRER